MKNVYSFTESSSHRPGFLQIDEDGEKFLIQTCTGGALLPSFVRMSEAELRELQIALNDRFPPAAKKK